jgi:hypothetical protein
MGYDNYEEGSLLDKSTKRWIWIAIIIFLIPIIISIVNMIAVPGK